MIKVELQDEAQHPGSPSLEQLQQWADVAINTIPRGIRADVTEFVARIIDRDESARLNKTFRKKDGATNILSFHYEEADQQSLGDLAICAAVIEDEATNQGKALEAHWAHIFIHGILHLAGYDHINEQDAQEMESLECEILQTLGYADPYQHPEDCSDNV